jgi:hexokinase
MEHVDDIPKIKNLGCDGADMAINCEWVGASTQQLFQTFSELG